MHFPFRWVGRSVVGSIALGMAFMGHAQTVGIGAAGPRAAAGAGPVAAPAVSNEVLAGIAAVDVTPQSGVSLAGYGDLKRRIIPFDVFNRYPYAHYFKPAEGVLDPIRAKVLVLQASVAARGPLDPPPRSPEVPRRLIFISLDLAGVPYQLQDDVIAYLSRWGVRREEVVVSATHTHSGPGGLLKSAAWEFLATDRFSRPVYERFLAGVKQAVARAMNGIQPVTLHRVAFHGERVLRNRRNSGRGVDGEGGWLLLRGRTGRWLGGLVNFPIHGTAMNSQNLGFSADVPGAIERELETRLDELNGGSAQSDATVLFVNGAEGDISPNRGGQLGSAILARELADVVVAELPRAAPVKPEWRVNTARVELGRPRFHVRACKEHRSARHRFNHRWAFKLDRDQPRHADLFLVKLGDLIILTWPGEPTASVGRDLKEIARGYGASAAWVFGLTNGHLAYFPSRREFREGGLEACMSLYGETSAEKLLDGFERGLSQMAAASPDGRLF